MVLSVLANGTAPLNYAWKRDGVLLEGQNTGSITLSNIGSTEAGIYSVEVANTAGLIESSGITVSVVQPVTIATTCGYIGCSRREHSFSCDGDRY